jgi:cytochrome P450
MTIMTIFTFVCFVTVIDGYSTPRGAVCSMVPYSPHRNEDVFPGPLE